MGGKVYKEISRSQAEYSSHVYAAHLLVERKVGGREAGGIHITHAIRPHSFRQVVVMTFARFVVDNVIYRVHYDGRIVLLELEHAWEVPRVGDFAVGFAGEHMSLVAHLRQQKVVPKVLAGERPPAGCVVVAWKVIYFI